MPTKKPRVRNPTPLDRFLPVDFECLMRVAQVGKLTMEFETDNQAINTKARLWRLRESLLHFQPNDPLAKVSRYFTFKISHNVVTIVDRVKSPEMRAQLASLTKTVQSSADPQELNIDPKLFGDTA